MRHPCSIRAIGLGVFVVLLLLSGTTPLLAQDLRLHISRDTVEIGDRFFISIAADHDFAQEAYFPTIDTSDTVSAPTGLPFTNARLQFGDVEVLGRELFLGRGAGGARRVDSAVYEVTTFALDSAQIAPISVRFSAGEDTFRVATAPQIITVVSLVPPETEDIRPLAPLAEFPRPIWPWFLLGLAILALLFLLHSYLRDRRNAPQEVVEAPPLPPIPPYQEAQERLRALEQMEPADPDQTKPFYIELADLLRTYLEKRVGVPALERTTRELTREMKQYARRGDVPEDIPQALNAVLSLADLVKFADMKPPSRQHERALAESRVLLDDIEEAVVHRAEVPVLPLPEEEEKIDELPVS